MAKREVKFESQDRRIAQINKVLNSYGIASIEEAEASISALEKDLEYEKQKFENSSRFIPECKELLSNYWDLSVPDRNKALKLLIDRVEYKKTVKNKWGTVDTPTFELTLKPRIPRI